MKTEFEKYIPNNLIEKAINLKEVVGGDELAWNYQDVMNVIDVLKEKNVIILGGDVYDQDLSYSYNSWAYDNLGPEESIEKTKKYIENYYQKVARNHYFALVIKNSLLYTKIK